MLVAGWPKNLSALVNTGCTGADWTGMDTGWAGKDETFGTDETDCAPLLAASSNRLLWPFSTKNKWNLVSDRSLLLSNNDYRQGT